jgi:GMP synthase (glutamine-hydrolysing)
MRAVLVSLRDPDDPMAEQELRCFQETSGLPGLVKVHAAVSPLDDALLESTTLFFFGGSGAYSVLDPHPWVRRMLDFLVQVVDRRVPAWASCFGFQGLALALGGEVNRDDERQELGAFPIDLTPEAASDPVFSVMKGRFPAQLGHHDHVDRLPAGVTLLATGERIRNQAFKVDGAPFWATQFHPELRKHTTLERWNYYRAHYGDKEQAAAIDRVMEASPDTPEAEELLRRFVGLHST